MKWKCTECGNVWESPLDERYSALSDKYSDDPASHCKECHISAELEKRAVIIISQVDVSKEIALAYAKAERTHFVATGQEVDIVQLMNISPTCGSIYDEKRFWDHSPILFAATILGLSSTTRENIGPNIGDEIKLEFDKPSFLFDKEPSKFFGKSKRNYRK